MKINGFIFDVDGTLVNSTPLHFKAWNTILDSHGIKLSAEEIYSQFGKTPIEVAQGYLRGFSHLKPEELVQEKTTFFMDHLDELIIFPFVQEFLTLLHEKHIKFVLASNGARATISKMTQIYDFLGFSEGIIAFEDVSNGKPHPEMVLKAIDLLQQPAPSVMMVGDSIYDIQAAQAAHVHTIAIQAPFNPTDFSVVQPTYRVTKFDEIKTFISEII